MEYTEAYILSKLRNLERITISLQTSIGAAAPAGSVSDVTPEGILNGLAVGQLHVQTSGGVISRVWYFNGTPGTSVGWI